MEEERELSSFLMIFFVFIDNVFLYSYLLQIQKIGILFFNICEKILLKGTYSSFYKEKKIV